MNITPYIYNKQFTTYNHYTCWFYSNIHQTSDNSSSLTCIHPFTPKLSSNLPNIWTNMHSSHVPTKLNVGSRLKHILILDNLHASFGGIDNITNRTKSSPQRYAILDLELECIRDTLKATFLNDLVNLLSDCIKEQNLFTLDGALSILANAFESNQFLCAEEL